MTSLVHKTCRHQMVPTFAMRWLLIAAVMLDHSVGSAGDGDALNTVASSPSLRKVRLVEEGSFSALKGNAQGVPVRLWDRSLEVHSTDAGVSWRGLSSDRLQWRFAPELLKDLTDGIRSRPAEPSRYGDLTSIRKVQFDVGQSKETPGIDQMKVCRGEGISFGGNAQCVEVPLRSITSPYQVAALPSKARLPIVFRSGRNLCSSDYSSCSVSFSSWRLAQELTGFSDGGRELPDLMWIEPHAGGTLALYDLRLSQHWATLELPDSLGQRVGRFQRASVTDNRVLVADFSSGSLLLDFRADSCRLLLSGEVWSCKEGLGASVVRDWLGGRYSAPSQEKNPGFSARAANWKLNLQRLGSESLRADLEGALPLAQSLEVALFQKGSIRFKGVSEIVSWEPAPFVLEQGFVAHRKDFESGGTILDWGGFGAIASGDGIAGGSYRSVHWKPGVPPSFLEVVRPPESRNVPFHVGRYGIYFASSSGLKYLSGAELKNTSIESSPKDVYLMGPDEALVRRGSGVTCQMVHLVAHRSFPASFLESGLALPCGVAWRLSVGLNGSVLAAWNDKAKRWQARWLN